MSRPSLTSVDKEMRANATKLLAEVIEQVKGLPDDDLEPLSEFFCDRIKDHHSIVCHVLTAFSALVILLCALRVALFFSCRTICVKLHMQFLSTTF